MFDNILKTKKNAFKTIKTRSLKIQKIGIFLKGLVHGFGQKYKVCPSFNFCKIVQKNVFLTIFLRKKNPLKITKTKS